MKRILQKIGLFATGMGSFMGLLGVTFTLIERFNLFLTIPIVFLSTTTVLSIIGLVEVSKKAAIERKAKNERMILGTILKNEKMITPTELALQTGMGITEAKERLDDLCEAGALELEVTNKGNLLYQLTDYLTLEEKYSAYLLNSKL